MATRTLVVMEDDIDGSPATATVHFALDGTEYTIDLSGRNAEQLRGDMEKWIKAAKKVGVPRSRKSKSSTDVDLRAVREWLRSQGHNVSDRGRVPASLQELYKHAH